MAEENTKTSMKQFLSNILDKGEKELNEGDYIEYANVLKKMFPLLKDLDNNETKYGAPFKNGFYFLKDCNLWVKPPHYWDELKIKCFVMYCSDHYLRYSEERKELYDIKYKLDNFVEDILYITYKINNSKKIQRITKFKVSKPSYDLTLFNFDGLYFTQFIEYDDKYIYYCQTVYRLIFERLSKNIDNDDSDDSDNDDSDDE